MPHQPVNGLILKKYSGFYYVQGEAGQIYECKLRAKSKTGGFNRRQGVDHPLDETHGIIERLEPRANELYRPRIANVDLVLIVMAYNRPEPVPMLLDRLLILILHAGLTPVIVLNKCDLEASQKAVDIMRIYKALGFEIIHTSAKQRCGLEQLLTAVKGKIAVFAGPSGTGKSTLLNSLVDNLAIKTQEVSAKIGRADTPPGT